MCGSGGSWRLTLPQLRWYSYEPIDDGAARRGAQLALGGGYRPHYDLTNAQTVVCLDADLLGRHPAAIRHARDFTSGRQIDPWGRRLDGRGEMNRLYAVESAYTLTGGMADHRLAVRASDVPALAVQLTAALRELGVDVPAPTSAEAGEAAGAARHEFVAAMARDLLAARGQGAVAVGPRQPAAVHALGHALNAALGNVGPVVTYTADPEPDRPSYGAALRELSAALADGGVQTLLIIGANPVYDAPPELQLRQRLTATGLTTIHLGHYRDETGRLCTWHLPRAHALESWGDVRAYDGSVSVVQPTIAPLLAGRTPIQLLDSLLHPATPEDEAPAENADEAAAEAPTVPEAAQPVDVPGRAAVRKTFEAMLPSGADVEEAWRQVLHAGVLADSAWPAAKPRLQSPAAWVSELATAAVAATEGLEVVLVPDAKVYDGRYANNGWLQEMPEPVSTLTWDNAAVLSPATAEAQGVRSGDVVTLTAGGGSIELPVQVVPGQADGSVTVALGYGRTAAGRVGDGVGANAYQLRQAAPIGAPNVLTGAELRPTGKHRPLAVTQDHHAIASKVGEQEQRQRAAILVREATVAHYREHPDFAQHAVHHLPLVSLWPEHDYSKGYRWGMTIDLNLCTGCGACVVACQAENNIPVVGREEVGHGREMQWLRVDRYFAGSVDEPRLVHQPMPCQQCENAPCEQVCPVTATVHTREGLNDMVYNRCIGTRYCSNNCPFKVRRFNWFYNHGDLQEIEKLHFNPEVTVRSRGVMEKCTYCVQRISAAKITAKNEGRTVRDGEVIPACAQTCPTGAIRFGDLNDPTSVVARLAGTQRAYHLLAELNIKPRTGYLARLTNPAPGLAVAHDDASHGAGHGAGQGGEGHDAGHDGAHAEPSHESHGGLTH